MRYNLAPVGLVVMIAFSTLFVSCSKEETHFAPSSNTSWRGNVKSIVDAQVAVASSTATAKKNGWGCAGADAAGALSGAAAGYELIPHWGAAVIGGIIGGAGASVAYWNDRMGRPTGNGPWDPYGPNPYDTRNPYSYAGILHNEICLAAIQDPAMFDPEGRLDMERLNTLGMEIITRRSSDFEALQGIELHDPISSMDFHPVYDKINSTIDNGDYVLSSANSDLNWFCSEFQRGLSSCSSQEEIRNYVSKLDEAILSSGLSEETKGSMLMSLSVLENSTLFWYE